MVTRHILLEVGLHATPVMELKLNTADLGVHPRKKSRASSEQARDGEVGRDVADSGTLGAPSVILPF